MFYVWIALTESRLLFVSRRDTVNWATVPKVTSLSLTCHRPHDAAAVGLESTLSHMYK